MLRGSDERHTSLAGWLDVPVNNGLLQKAVRESLALTLVIGAGLCGVEVLFARIIPAFYGDMTNNLLSLPFVRKMVAAVLGTDAAGEMGPATMMAVVWTHPVVLALVWALAIWAGTRVPAGEVDRGTCDLLLSLPVSRRQVLICEAIVALLGGIVLVFLGFVGNAIGGWPLETSIVGTAGMRLWVIGNLWAVYVVVYGASCLASSFSERRGRATGVIVALLIASFVVNFLGVFSEPIRRVGFLSILDYYRPLFILQNGVVPLGDIAILLALGVSFWVAACTIFVRRDIRTV